SSGKGGTNFVETMLRLAQKGEPIRVVADQVLGPSYTRDLAPKVWRVLPRAAHQVYHLTNAGQTSWHGFARRVFELAGVATEGLPGVARLRRGEEVADRLDRHEQRVHRQQHDREAELPEPREGQERRAAAGRVVVEERRLEGARHALDLSRVAGRLDEEHVRA